jgi:hypothetical protein
MGKIRYFRSAMSLLIPVTSSQVALMLPFILFAIISLPLKAHSIDCNVSGGSVRFSVIKGCPTCELACIYCAGPWARVSPWVDIDDLEHNKSCTFYAAKDSGAFPMWGRWTCFIYEKAHGFCTTVLAEELTMKDFCVENSDSEVTLKIEGEDANFIDVDKPSPPCVPSVLSFLGDNPKQEKSKPDSDEFLFDGSGGDQVTLTLETDSQLGNNGGEASLGISANSLNESTTGAPPLEINVTLPEDGQYSIIVEQPKKSADRFRGSYILTITPGIGTIGLIEPTNNVEK